jgi:hypothetical protein
MVFCLRIPPNADLEVFKGGKKSVNVTLNEDMIKRLTTDFRLCIYKFTIKLRMDEDYRNCIFARSHPLERLQNIKRLN